MIPIIYRADYNITAFGLEKAHPFDGSKYARIWRALIERGLRSPRDFVRPPLLARAGLERVHTDAYLDSLRQSATLASVLELPLVRKLPRWLVDWRILRPMRLATSGTVVAGRLALKQGMAINLGGGFHHASSDWGDGFCIYADVPLACKILHEERLITKVLVVDLDAHQGNGTAHAIRDWSWASIFDIYQGNLFPSRKEPEEYPLPVRPGLTGYEYLSLLSDHLPRVLDEVQPDLLFYNAGSDPVAGDPLAGFLLAPADIEARDLFVVTQARERGTPVAMVLSGGYSRDSWKVHADAIEAILTRLDRSPDEKREPEGSPD